MKAAHLGWKFLSCFVLLAGSTAMAEDFLKYPTMGTIERLDKAFDKLIPPDAKIEKLAEGFEWAEGPVWNRQENFVLFSDIPNNAVNKWQPGKPLTLFLKPAGYTGKKPRGGEPGSNGLLYDSKGRLILCQHGDRRIARLEGQAIRHAGRQVQGQAAQQPQRRRVQIERRSVLHRSAVRHG